MRIAKATRRYEEWLAGRVDLVAADLERKHERMGESPFLHLRATFYRWAERFAALCPELTAAPEVLGVGDLHVDNFGTWRDAEGRLCWGVNDFDEAARLPYTNDLVRLCCSALAARRELHLGLGAGEAIAAIAHGYRHSLEEGGSAFVLDGENRWLHDLAHERDARRFWDKLEAARPATDEELPRGARSRLERALPDGARDVRFAFRVAGCGSLGRPRVVALARVEGHPIARETKPLVPSAWGLRVPGAEPDETLHYMSIVERAVRSHDPFLHVDKGWVVRRLSPICAPIELAGSSRREEERLFRAMGYEAANVHLGSRRARKAILADLDERKAGWLEAAAHRMLDSVDEDFAAWRERRPTDEPEKVAPPSGSGAGA